MGYFSRKHKLPRFPESLIPTFRRLCEPLPVEAVPDIRGDLDECVRNLQLASEANKRINVHRILQIQERCEYLLGRYESFSREQQALVIGALRYFVIVDDTLADDTFITGFDDDAKVVNYVLEELGIEDQFIPID
ncbi:MAG: hypothetical protein J0M12_05980 [Deltaproteobacteria bacterium]|nr:hypothetical protein [Deltaproteobacteria bacterium]